MKLSQFKFNLPSELIALQPTQNRDEARLMVVDRKTGKIEHRIFKDLIDYVKDGDVFVINNTKVFPAKLYGKKEKTEADIEVLLLRELDHDSRLWDVLVDPARKIRIGNKLYFGEGESLVAEVIDNTTSRGRTLRFLYDGTYEEFKKTLSSLGHTPIPKELNRAETPEDAENFQTIYAKVEGAVSAPTAGMHFSKILMKRLEIIGASFAELTLHPGMGNFRDIEVEDLTKHKMDSEQMFIGKEACNMVNQAKLEERHVCVVGTSVLKATETAVGTDKLLKEYEGWTNKFIFPPYECSVADSMIANFYHPMSTLLMETAAFGGYDLVMEAYDKAVEHGYMFGCYGDALLILDD